MESRIRILLVDDDPNTIVIVKPFLERAGYRVTSAFDGKTVLLSTVPKVKRKEGV